MPSSWLRSRGKRFVDLAIVVPALVVVVPVIGLAALLVVITMGRPVFFRHERAGLQGQPFHVLKLRTMRRARFDGEPDASRITRLGRLLRALSVDELPQVWNVVRGDMSLVGPRPLPVAYVARYRPEQRVRLDARPGITGLAQVRGRNALSWEEKFRLDAEYVGNASLRTDLSVIVATVVAVVTLRGISASGHATMPEFLGDEAP